MIGFAKPISRWWKACPATAEIAKSSREWMGEAKVCLEALLRLMSLLKSFPLKFLVALLMLRSGRTYRRPED
jgi:hypothetical protein